MSTVHQQIKQRLLKEESNSVAEVSNTFGRADIVTPSEVIEISNITGYKEAFGRVLAYTSSPTFSSRKLQPRLHIFCDDSNSYLNFEKHILQVAELCRNKIRLTFGTNMTSQINFQSFIKPVPPVIVTPQLFSQQPAPPSLPSLSTPPNTSTPSKIKKFNRFKN